MNTWLFIYFSINLFLSGCYFTLAWVRGDTFWQKARAVMFAVVIVFFGLLGLAILLATLIFVGLLDWVDSTFKISFIFEFYFSKKYKNLKDFQVSSLKKSYDSLEKSKGLRHVISRKYIRMILKRHSQI